MKNKRKSHTNGIIMAFVVFFIVLALGFSLGKYIAIKYNESHGTNYSLLKVLTIVSESKPQKLTYQTNYKITSLCQKSTGICDKEVGTFQMNQEHSLKVYYDFDNLDQKINYVKLDDTKLGTYTNINNVLITNTYIIITETIKGDNYHIYLYNEAGKLEKTLNATYRNGEIFADNNELYYYYCDQEDLNENGEKALKQSQLKDLKSIEKTKEYGKC